MAVTFAEAYEGGTQGATITTGNSGWTGFSNPSLQTFDNTHAVTGTYSVKVVCAATTAYQTKTLSATNLSYFRFYLWMDAAPSANTLICRVLSGATTRAELRMNTGRTIDTRNAAVVTGTATAALPLGEWVRIVWTLNGNTASQSLTAHWGANLHTTTASTSVTGSPAYTNNTFDTFRLGSQTSATYTVWYDQLVIDGTTVPNPAMQTGAGPDSSTVTDSAARVVALARAGADTSAVTDAGAGVPSAARAGSSTSTVTDTGARSWSTVRAGSDSAGVSSAGTRARVTDRAGSDTSQGTDISARALSVARAGSDTATAGSSPARAVTTARGAADTTTATSTGARVASVSTGSADSTTGSTAAGRVLAVQRAAGSSSAATSTGGAVVTPAGSSFTRGADDTATVTDTTTRAVALQRPAGSTTAVTDAGALVTGRARAGVSTTAGTSAGARAVAFARNGGSWSTVGSTGTATRPATSTPGWATAADRTRPVASGSSVATGRTASSGAPRATVGHTAATRPTVALTSTRPEVTG